MFYRISTRTDGQKRWWQETDAIPRSHHSIRPATIAETDVIDQIIEDDSRHHRLTDRELSESISYLLALTD